jgi:anti-sigma factor RsiW
MNCPLKRVETTDLLLEYSARRLDASKAAVLARHIEVCAECSAFLAGQTAVWDALDAWEPPPVSMDFNRRLWQRIDRAAEMPWYRGLFDALRAANWKPVFPMAAAVLVIAGGFLLDHRGERAVTPNSATPGVSGVSIIEADQLDQTLDDIQLLRQLDSVAPSGSSDRAPKKAI